MATGRDRDCDVVDSGNQASRRQAGDAGEYPGGGDGEHQDTGCRSRRLDYRGRKSEGAAQDHDFERFAQQTKAERSATQASDAAGRQLDEIATAIGVDPHLSMNWTHDETDGGDSFLYEMHCPFLNIDRMAGRGYVEGLFKERALQRIGFIDDRQQLHPVGAKQALDDNFCTRDVLLNQQLLGRRQLGRIKDRSHPVLGNGGLSRIVGPDHPSAC